MTEQVEIQAALKAWRDGLVGLTRQSPLIKFRAARTSSLQIDAPSPDEVLTRLQSGKPQELRGEVDPGEPGPPAPPPGLTLHSPRPDGEVGPVVRNLMRKSSAELLDRGLSVLYVAFGMLDWQDIDDEPMVSPLLLVPVKLISQGPKATPKITHHEEEDSILNPALTLRLKEFGINLPADDEIEGSSVSEVLATVRAELRRGKTLGEWSLRETCYLATFSFAKEAMYKDLLDNEEQILDHPIVRSLATSDPTRQSSEFQFDPISPAEIDRLAPPEVTPLVLDADSTQRVAVAAALTGKTFIMDGPPGTGKSQTIANMIGALLHSGRSVLFVSEKMAALEVVRNRLAAAGLGSYLLELHSHKASRKEVATELLTTLDYVVKPPSSMPSRVRQGAKQRREQLNNYAEAMNEIRMPLNMSLHRVLGHYSSLCTAPVAPVPEQAPINLTEAAYHDMQETLSRLVRAWRPAAQGSSFLWKDVADPNSLEARLYQASVALDELNGMITLNSDVVDAFELTKLSDTPQIWSLIAHQKLLPADGVMEQWLTATDLEPLHSLRADLGSQIAQLKAAEESVYGTAGVPWKSLPRRASIPVRPQPVNASPFPVDIEAMTASELATAAEQFAADSRMLSDQHAAMISLGAALGVSSVSTFADVDRLLRLIELRSRNTCPDPRWFSRHGLAEARGAVAALRAQIAALSTAEEKALQLFLPEALDAPLAELQERFANLHKGLRKLSGSYRADKRSVAGLLTDAADVKSGIKHLADAVAWHSANAAFKDTMLARADVLGQHWSGRETDFDALASALNVADEVLTLTEGTVPALLVTYMSGRDSNAVFESIAATAVTSLSEWKSRLAPGPAPAGRPQLLVGTITQAIDWLSAHIGPMQQGISRIDAISEVTRRGHSLAEVDNIVGLVGIAEASDDELRGAESAYRSMIGYYFEFGNTDLEALDRAIGWAAELRVLAGQPLGPRQIKALTDCSEVPAMAQAYDKWTKARDAIISAFGPSRHAELMDELDDYSGAVDLMNDFGTDTIGQQEWFEYQRAYSALTSLGLNTAVDFCIEQRLSAQEVPGVVNRALLRAWSDAVIQSDDRLQPVLASEREALVEQYRNLDRDLINAATAEIIIATNGRRPANTTMGESGVIRREGSKQKKHIPVRELMSRSRNVTMSIKPVFMMSPLAVSQYLPSDMQFDVVIFDEASQVTPGDAINCIYRAKSLILAGDDKQLPPTSFFERAVDDDDDETDVKDFQSVLELAKATGAFNNLGLRWHYRSRHEDLIAFSNYKFYGGKLVTFPSAHSQGDNVGVEFFNAHGTYRRGGGAFNPIEANMVADRVINHLTNYPQLTLGVVTFSVAQADAVQNAIDDARVSRRDLDRFFDTEDRLDGFFIRALEQVQGDERDVIIFSIGYGPDEAGKISTNFGALNKDKGWRRLNVGITRARQRVEVVASMSAGQIPPSNNENVEYFRAYLDFAERGPQTLAVPYSSTGLDPESPFEESVIDVIRGWGYNIEPQVGAAGFRIDIGVRHPAHPGMFAIGVECDGYQYHSAPAARDRDRLRDQILTGLGWRLHRIWGTAWYRDRSTEEARLQRAIEEAIAAPLHDRTKKAPLIERRVVETEEAMSDVAPIWTSAYKMAPVRKLPRWVEPGEPGNHLHMVDAVEALVGHEGPIHLDVAFDRFRSWWNIGHVGAKIRKNIDLAINRAHVVRDGDFLMLPGADVNEVRTPTDDASRKAQHVHLEELGMAAILLVRDVGAVSRSELVQGVARVFGWTRTGAIVDQRVNEAIDLIVGDGRASVGPDGVITPRRDP